MILIIKGGINEYEFGYRETQINIPASRPEISNTKWEEIMTIAEGFITSIFDKRTQTNHYRPVFAGNVVRFEYIG